MQLLFDIGNTRIKWACYYDGEIQSSGSFNAVDNRKSVLDEAFSGSDKPDSIWISNVGSATVLDVVIDWCEGIYELKPNVIKISKSFQGINNNYQSQESLGVDRWVAAIGARLVVPLGDVIIIDAGTAVTIDWLSHNDVFEGGVILPGFSLMHDSLIRNTAGIKSEFSQSQKIIGRTTEECVNSGVSYGLVGAIERIVREIQQGIAQDSTILLTGGSALLIDAMSNFNMIVQQDLVLLGVASIAKESC